jgi:hypothetical protein
MHKSTDCQLWATAFYRAIEWAYELGAGVRDTIIGDLSEAVAHHMDDEGVTFPMETYLVIARR